MHIAAERSFALDLCLVYTECMGLHHTASPVVH